MRRYTTFFPPTSEIRMRNIPSVLMNVLLLTLGAWASVYGPLGVANVGGSVPDKSPEFQLTLYNYRAKVVDVYDADTVTLEVELGLGVTVSRRFRLAAIDAWELRGDEREKGLAARDWLRGRLAVHPVIYVQTLKDSTGKYGRYLGYLYVLEGERYLCLNDELVTLGHAEYRSY